MHALFVSDLHLSPQRPAMCAAFARLLQSGEARKAEAFYILGDLFDYWIGDDDLHEPLHAQVAADLGALTRSGCSVYFMPGNRDFLLGSRFAEAAGLAILPDPTRIDLAGASTLLLHGDTLCIDDVDYLAFRAKVHEPGWQRQFLGQTLAQRRAVALQLRAESTSSQSQKTAEIMDVAPRAVEQAFRDHACTRMIHGHTHRPGQHEYTIDGQHRERWVLSDWYRRASWLRCDAHGCTAVEEG